MIREADWRIYEQTVLAAEKYLEGISQAFGDKGIDCRTMVRQGEVVSVIIETARQEDANLIAIASHGHTGLASVFYGSVAAGVLHRTDRPLFLIRAED